MELLSTYIPLDRRRAMSKGETIPDRLVGVVLFADISGFTPLTDALLQEFGLKRGAEALTQKLNLVYDALITQVHRFEGSVISFGGDAITCWFDQVTTTEAEVKLRATACGLAMQRVMGQFRLTKMPSGKIILLGVKVVVTAGPVRRFQVGDPNIQLIDILAGQTLDRMAAAEKIAKSNEVLAGSEIVAQLDKNVEIAAWRQVKIGANKRHFAVVSKLTFFAAGFAEESDQAVPAQPALSGISQNLAALESLSSIGINLTETQVRPWLLRPVYERLRNQQAQFLAEIRPTVALFMKFEGLAYDRDDTAGEQLDGFVRLVQNILASYEGYLIQLTIGDKGSYFYAVFGAPLAHDDDQSRAVAAALALRSLPDQLPFINQMQIAISQGLMRVGPYGSPARRTYGVLGNEVNIAARLMEQAQPGQIMVSQHIAEVIERSYHLRSIAPVTVKGKPEPIPVALVVRRRLPTSQKPATRFANLLVGRAAEMGQLMQRLEAALAGQGQVLHVVGEAGIGKSHLAVEFGKRALTRDARIAVGTCESTMQGIAYYPWRQLFRTLFELEARPLDLAAETLAEWTARQIAALEAKLEAINPAWLIRLPLLGGLLNLAIPDNETTAAFAAKLRQEARVTLAVELIQHWAKTQPLLLLIEDAHWLDEASRNLTLALARVMAQAPVLMLLVRRPTEPPLIPELDALAYNHQVSLAELTAAETADLIGQRLHGRVSPLLTELIQARAQGNPFFCKELVDALRETKGLQRQADGQWELAKPLLSQLQRANCVRWRAGGWTLIPDAPLQGVDLNLPDTVQGTVLSRLDHLPEPHQLTMKVASVIGRVFEVKMLAQAHPHRPDRATLLDQLAIMEARDLLRLEAPESQRYMFKHNIAQEVAYETLLEEQQRELHQAVAEALEATQSDAVERLAYHYHRSSRRDKTLFYLDQAARKTQREYANETALNYYTLALELEERWEWRKGQVEIYHLLGDREAEAEALAALATIPDAPVFEVGYLQGHYYEALSDYTEAQAATERALAASRAAGDLAGEVRCLAQLGLVAYRQGDYRVAEKFYNEALTLYQSNENYPAPVIRAFTQAFNGLGIAQVQQGNFDRATIYYKRVLDLNRLSNNPQGEANTLFGLGLTAFYQRHLEEAQNYYKQTLRIQRVIGDRIGEGTSLCNLAQVDCDIGDYGQALEHLSAALAIVQATGNRWDEISILNSLGIVYQELGLLSEAESCLQRGVELAREIDAWEAKASYLLSNLGLVMRDQENLVTANKILIEGFSLMKVVDNKRQMAFFLSYLSSVNLQAENFKQAMEYAQEAIELWKILNSELRATDDLAILAAAHLATGNLTKALSYAEQVLTLLEECGGKGPEFPQKDYFIVQEILKATRQEERSFLVLEKAYNLVNERAKKITNPTLRQSFLENVAINQKILEDFQKQSTNQPNSVG